MTTFNAQIREVQDKIDELIKLNKGENTTITYSIILMLLFFGIGWLLGFLVGKG